MGTQSKLARADGGILNIFLNSPKRSLGAGAIIVSSAIYIYITKKWASKSNRPDLLQTKKGEDNVAKQRVAVDWAFFKRLYGLLKILIPGPFTSEAGYLLLVAFAMLSRTWCDVWMLKNGTAIERTIVSRNYQEFLVVFLNFIMAFFPISLVNNLLRYGLNELALRFRKRLTTHLYKEYLNGTPPPSNTQMFQRCFTILFFFSTTFGLTHLFHVARCLGFTYYKVSNLDNRIANADQLLTQDVEKFCTSVSELYSNISKPILDIVIYARKLSGAIGVQGKPLPDALYFHQK